MDILKELLFLMIILSFMGNLPGWNLKLQVGEPMLQLTLPIQGLWVEIWKVSKILSPSLRYPKEWVRSKQSLVCKWIVFSNNRFCQLGTREIEMILTLPMMKGGNHSILITEHNTIERSLEELLLLMTEASQLTVSLSSIEAYYDEIFIIIL